MSILMALFSGWAICTICMGFVHNFAGLLVARIFLGKLRRRVYNGQLLISLLRYH